MLGENRKEWRDGGQHCVGGVGRVSNASVAVARLVDGCNLCVKNPDEQRFLIANRHDGASAHIGFCGDGADGRVLVSVRDKVLFCSGKDGVFGGQALFLSCRHE